MKWVEEQPSGAFAIFKDREMKDLLEKFAKDDIALVESSHRNELVFKIHLKKASPKTKKLVYHFKVITRY